MIVLRRREPRRQRQHNGNAERHRVADLSEQMSAFGVAIVLKADVPFCNAHVCF